MKLNEDIRDALIGVGSAATAVGLFEYAQELHSFFLAGVGGFFLVIAFAVMASLFRRP